MAMNFEPNITSKQSDFVPLSNDAIKAQVQEDMEEALFDFNSSASIQNTVSEIQVPDMSAPDFDLNSIIEEPDLSIPGGTR